MNLNLLVSPWRFLELRLHGRPGHRALFSGRMAHGCRIGTEEEFKDVIADGLLGPLNKKEWQPFLSEQTKRRR